MRTIFLLLILIPLVFTDTIDSSATAVDATNTDANAPITDSPVTTPDNAEAVNATTTDNTEAANTETAAVVDTTGAAETPGTTEAQATNNTTTATPQDTTATTPQETAATPAATQDTTVAAKTTTSGETHVATPSTVVSTTGTQFAAPAPPLYGGLILPYVRATTIFNTSNTAICGGTAKDKVHFMTSQSVLNEFRWYIETPFSDSTCQFRVTENLDQGDDTGYLVIHPSNRKDVRADGSFPCGRTAGTDSAMFDIPDEIDCDACVLEWIWRGPNFEVRQCSDITVMSGDDATCLGTCLNGGMCKRGVCVCPAGYTGDNCQYAPGAIIKSFKKIFIIIAAIVLAVVLIIAAIALLSWCADKRIKDGERDQRYHTNKKQTYMEFDPSVPGQPYGVDQPATHLRAEPRSGY